MEEADKFAADILGVNPDTLSEESSDELLTNNEDESSESIDDTQEESQSSNKELSDEFEDNTEDETQQEEADTEIQEPKRTNRIQKRIQQLLARQNEFVQQEPEYEDTLTREELQDLVRREAQMLMEKQEIARLQEEQTELWAEDLSNLIETNPELNPESPEYNKQLDDFLTSLVVDEYGEPKTNVPISEIYSQLNAIVGERKQAQAKKNRKVLAGQFDEAPLGDGSQGEYQRSKKSIEDLDPNDPVSFMKAIQNGEV